MKNHYKEKFWNYGNEELKDIISGRFREASSDEVTAAIELLKERNQGPAGSDSTLSLAQIPSSSLVVLLEIVKNPHLWSQDAVEIAEAEILRREKQPADNATPNSGNKTLLQGILAVLGVIITVVLVKLLIGMVIILFFFYCVLSCLNDL